MKLFEVEVFLKCHAEVYVGTTWEDGPQFSSEPATCTAVVTIAADSEEQARSIALFYGAYGDYPIESVEDVEVTECDLLPEPAEQDEASVIKIVYNEPDFIEKEEPEPLEYDERI